MMVDTIREKIDIPIKAPFLYDYSGETKQAEYLTVYCPMVKHKLHQRSVHQYFSKALTNISKGTSEEEKEEIIAKEAEVKKLQESAEKDKDGGPILSEEQQNQQAKMMYTMLSSGLNAKELEGLIKSIKLILCDGTLETPSCLVDGQVHLTATLFDSLDFKDEPRLIGGYVSHFFT